MFTRRLAKALFAIVITAVSIGGPAAAGEPKVKSVAIGHGIRLHYVEEGSGPPLILIHGSLSDYSYWDDQVAPFAARYTVIAYSRRYDFPNRNPPRPGYSAITDAEDLADLIKALHPGKVYIVGHSYGALTTLFLTAHHPELVSAAVLAEPPAVSLLQHLPGEQGPQGQKMFVDIQDRMIAQ